MSSVDLILCLMAYQPIAGEDKGVHNIPKCTCPKVNVIAWLEIELAYYDSAVQPLRHEDTHLRQKGKFKKDNRQNKQKSLLY